jgi:hypothetical protein
MGPATDGCAAAGPGGGGERAARKKPMLRRLLDSMRRTAAAVGGAAAIGAVVSCVTPLGEPHVYAEAAPSSEERYCAWFGDAREDILYFGEAPFWWAYRRHAGDPRADLRHPGPQLVGRFDLRRLAFLEPLDLAPAASAGGVWDVLAHPNGRVYFTDFFGASGYVEPESGRVVRFPATIVGADGAPARVVLRRS